MLEFESDIAWLLRLSHVPLGVQQTVRSDPGGSRAGWDTYFCIARFLAQLMYSTSHFSIQKTFKNKKEKKNVKSIAFRFLQFARGCHGFRLRFFRILATVCDGWLKSKGSSLFGINCGKLVPVAAQ